VFAARERVRKGGREREREGERERGRVCVCVYEPIKKPSCTATHYNTLLHTAKRRINKLYQRSLSHGNALQQIATHCKETPKRDPHRAFSHGNILWGAYD